VSKTHRTVILGYLVFLGLFFFALYGWFESPQSVGGFAMLATVPMFICISIGFLYFAIRIWKLKQLQKFASLAMLVGFMTLVLFGLQVPKTSQEFVEFKLTQYGYRTSEKFSLIFKENKAEFERVASEISTKIGNHPCDENTITEKQDITLKQSFLGIPLRLHPICWHRIITIPIMTFHGLGEANSWMIMYVIDWKKGAKLEKTCGEGASCDEVAPGWIEYVFVT
jgi:hypothetical protein